jgi:hypothetical protein
MLPVIGGQIRSKPRGAKSKVPPCPKKNAGWKSQPAFGLLNQAKIRE